MKKEKKKKKRERERIIGKTEMGAAHSVNFVRKKNVDENPHQRVWVTLRH